MARAGKKTGTEQTLVNRPRRATKSVYKTVETQPVGARKRAAIQRTASNNQVDNPPGQDAPTDNPRVGRSSTKSASRNMARVVDNPLGRAPHSENLRGLANEQEGGSLTEVAQEAGSGQVPGWSNPGGNGNGQAASQTLTGITPELNKLIQDRVEQIIAQARQNADNPRGGSSQQQNGRPSTDRPSVQLEREQINTTCTDDENTSDGERARPRKVRNRKRRAESRKNKSTTERERTRWSDCSSDEGKSDRSEEYDTEEDESMAVLRESCGMMVGENLPAKQREKILTGKFVEMSSLLPQNYTKDSDTVYRITRDGIKPAKQRVPTHLSLEEWNEAFGIFKAIMVEKPGTAAEVVLLVKQLETHQRDINTLARQGKSWQLYDRMFRADLAESRSKVTYGTIRHDLMLNIKNSHNRDRPFRGRRDRPTVPTKRKWRQDWKPRSRGKEV